jgi:hypothetical protein
MAQYDDSAASYVDWSITDTPYSLVELYVFLRTLGSVRDLDVLDVACGDGPSPRFEAPPNHTPEIGDLEVDIGRWSRGDPERFLADAGFIEVEWHPWGLPGSPPNSSRSSGSTSIIRFARC